MTLPRLLLITDRSLMQPSFDAALEAALRGGVRFIQLREKDLPPCSVLDLALRAQRLCENYGARLVINSRADIARAAHADGVHLPENDVPPTAARLSLGFHTLCGVSVHSVASAERAVSEGADYLVFGPVFETMSHQGTVPVGLEALQEITQAVSPPVFAIGGIEATSTKVCLDAGAHGIAVISAVWRSTNIEDAVRRFITSGIS